jgi:hypothetical protein
MIGCLGEDRTLTPRRARPSRSRASTYFRHETNGIEPSTSALTKQCSTPELRPRLLPSRVDAGLAVPGPPTLSVSFRLVSTPGTGQEKSLPPDSAEIGPLGCAGLVTERTPPFLVRKLLSAGETNLRTHRIPFTGRQTRRAVILVDFRCSLRVSELFRFSGVYVSPPHRASRGTRTPIYGLRNRRSALEPYLRILRFQLPSPLLCLLELPNHQ